MARPSKPWYRAEKGTWYCTVGGKKISLGVQGRENKKAAEEAWHRVMAGMKEEKAGPKAEPTVTVVVEGFLADCEGRVKPKTVRGYRDFLRPFVERYGALPVSALTPPLAEAYSRKPEWSDSTRHDFLGTLAGAFRWAERARVIDRTPLLGPMPIS